MIGVSGSTLLSSPDLTFGQVPIFRRFLSFRQHISLYGPNKHRWNGKSAGDNRRRTMTDKLPQLLADYFAAKNRHDIDAMLHPLRTGCDGSRRRRNPSRVAAIHNWMEREPHANTG